MSSLAKNTTSTIIPCLRYRDAPGADMVVDIKTEEYGGRGFACRDLEGHIWYFGTYDPWVSN